MTNSHLKLITPNSEIRTVTPRRPKNAEVRSREHLTPGEVETLMEAARQNRHGDRDATMILMAYRHGLRAAAAFARKALIAPLSLTSTHYLLLALGCSLGA